ncbi:MAG: thiamine pyrophosphate-binding protein [Candidatus Glassbacteria bacterium]|nr:thiamine pyrophosphate-binding protein [Candidatus Glassbacteria bacterium]
MKACDFIVRYLAETAGMKHVFTYAGGTNAMLMDSMVRHGGIRIIPVRHEQNAALAADGYARVKGDFGFAMAMSGPGATNLMTGIVQSYFDSSPVFFLTGNVTTGTYKYDRPLRQLGYQETDIVSLVKPVTKGAYFVDSIGRVPLVLRSALRQVVSGRKGPVLYDVPFDIQKLEVDEKNLEVSFGLPGGTVLPAGERERFFSLLEDSRRPVILAGGGVQLSGATDGLAGFARKFKLPVVSSLLGRDAFPNDDPLYAGYIGVYGNRHANLVLDRADLVIALGSRIDSRQTAEVREFTRNKKIIHVDIDPQVIGSTVEPDLGINMDLKDFFRDLDPGAEGPLEGWKPRDSWLDVIGQLKELLSGDTEEDEGGLNPKKFLRKLSLAQPRGTVYTVDIGSHQMWSAQCCVLKQGDRFLASGGLGTMGYAIPSAIGAHFADPGRPVVAIVGDGGFQMSIPELSTIAEFDVPVKIVVMNNRMLGLMKNFQDENFGGVYPATVDGYAVPDVCGIARVYGLPGRVLSADEETDDALGWLAAQKGKAVLEVKVPRAWGPYPKVVRGCGLAKQHPALSDSLERKVRKVLET